MAQFDVFRLDADTMVVDVQSDFHEGLRSRLTVPVQEVDVAGHRAKTRLNPIVVMNGQNFVVMTEWAASVPDGLLRQPVGSLADHRDVIIGAFDMLLTGF
ncbi:CcdB family protein [Sandaracinobacteroides saxicola]|uniref:Toxin CcdB n=1 Tax=Sandaracinobacteroides saxicola TaxID=2759707 RepID=A0A7G5IJG5_9SPHN|nr:CcdB family protein [Sandaracinobacteroides saxicola]QMW23507.1 CcdB family protein [Sandaracinobacteroides saxicola]